MAMINCPNDRIICVIRLLSMHMYIKTTLVFFCTINANIYSLLHKVVVVFFLQIMKKSFEIGICLMIINIKTGAIISISMFKNRTIVNGILA